MFQITALVLTLCGATLIYLTNRHQGLIRQRLPKPIRQIGYGLFILALACWLQVLTTSAAIFTWIFTSITLLTCIPLLSLSKKREDNG
ncbi:hypothetical protein Sps_02740 [Shewanella psychrophila]|uniref:Uncharacterized protein n=1 Tax=Shewanella psychrophila TaxID=225848 RepID=A0A1S6HQV9_9GAMM|nr:hypothetical protein [Shewanella psychrophila]AQS37892.1 hypothetical protein Sps_02740 [Shewanella psychrophila]